MIRKILLKNFMAHSHTEIALGPRMNVLTGPNNTGKSAVVEALRCLAENPTPRHFIRHGAKKARVEVELDDGTRVAWVRSKTSAIYEVTAPDAEEPEVYAKLGRGGVPDDIRDLLRLDRVALDSTREDVDVHIGNQRNPVFLLCDPGAGSTLAEFFAASSESAHLLAMQKALKTRVREARREEQDRRQRMDRRARELDGLADLPRLALELETARDRAQELDRLARLIPALERDMAERSRLERGLRHARAQSLALSDLMEPAQRLWPVAGLDEQLKRRKRLDRGLEQARQKAVALADMTAPPEVFDTRSLARRLEQAARLRQSLTVCKARVDGLEPLREPPRLHAVAEQERLLRRLGRVQAELSRARGRSSVCNDLQQPPDLFDEGPLDTMLTEMQRVTARIQAKREHLQARVEGLQRLEERIGRVVDEAGNCPLCGGVMDAARLTGKAETGTHGDNARQDHNARPEVDE